MDKELLDILACPKCKGDLEYKNQGLLCHGCKLKYRIEDGIPIMLIDEAEQIE
ncbi:MAG: tetraacyldisaccharide 4'-kinase [Candidatus Altiarchaeales archaeon WOR_SM1_86-2]|nr:MAG: tetraacyldisaccharide 4'-kinase [Candidatus Altiarchaeales archaeon WOR_SM1_86-2]